MATFQKLVQAKTPERGRKMSKSIMEIKSEQGIIRKIFCSVMCFVGIIIFPMLIVYLITEKGNAIREMYADFDSLTRLK